MDQVRSAILCLLCAAAAAGQPKVYTYIGAVGPDHVLIAWGTTTGGGNTIGRDSKPLGAARVEIGPVTVDSTRNWTRVTGLTEDTEYTYKVSIDGRQVGQGTVRTWPRQAERLAFFVIGDYGNGSLAQYRVAKVMIQEAERRRRSNNPVRFVATTGDNIYGAFRFTSFGLANTGNRDQDWEAKFFAPYEALIRGIPFYPTLGNHDGNMTEARGDLPVYLDNFFFPSGGPTRYYWFNYGGLADFFALDTSSSTEKGDPQPMHGPQSRQDEWLARELSTAKAPWKLPYFHHPPLNAGPRHSASGASLADWMKMFEKAGVRVVFNGHEHNFQFSRPVRGVRYVISGAGGELRGSNIQAQMERAGIEGWAPQLHFLLVTIEKDVMEITPLADEPIVVRNARNEEIKMPLRVTLR
jgi:hypothetical protein